jgi:chemotaxis-related protein WspD
MKESSQPEELWELLLQHAVHERYPPGHVLMEEGRPSDAVYFMIKGKVSVGRGDAEVNTQSERTVLGEMGVLLEQARNATVICVTEVESLRLEGTQFLRIIEEFPTFMRSIFHEALSKVLAGPDGSRRPSKIGWENLFETYSRRLFTADRACWQRIGLWGDKSCVELEKVIHCRNCPVFAEGGRTLLDRRPEPGYLDTWSESIALPKDRVAADTHSVVIFRLGEEWLALRTRNFKEVTIPRPGHRLPHRTNDVMLGLVNIRGELLICFSLARLLGVADAPAAAADAPSGQRKLVVIEKEAIRSAFPVDEILCMYEIPAHALADSPVTIAKASNAFSSGVFVYDGRHVGLIDEELLFYTLERNSL